MYVRQRNDGDALDGDEDLTGVADAFHIAFGAFVEAVGDADAVAGTEAVGVAAQVHGVGVGAGDGGGDAEDLHLAVGDAAGALGDQVGVVEHVRVVGALVVEQVGLGAVHEEERCDQGLLDVAEFAGFEVFFDHHGEVGVVAQLPEVFLHGASLAVKDFECVPGGLLCVLRRLHAWMMKMFSCGCIFHSPTPNAGCKAGYPREIRRLTGPPQRALY